MMGKKLIWLIRLITLIYLIFIPVLLSIAILGAPNWYFELLRWIIFIVFFYGSYVIFFTKSF